MFSKLAFSNVKKSLKDYTIYFLTLTFGVCLFYMFNSIESQQAMLEVSTRQHQMLQLLTTIMGYVSIFISIILAFLIIYANNFLIKRRKKELGIYMVLGMPKGRISRIVIFETFLIGLISLAVGLILGIFASQGLSVLTAKMFEVNLKSFEFIFSSSAMVRTILYFGLIFALVMLFNTITISKYRLINLIHAQKKNQTLKLKKLWVSVLLFLLSLLCLGAAYYMILENGMLTLDWQFTGALIFGALGTLLFFRSLSGFLLRIIKSNKKLYLKNLNMFVLRQINSKINTTYVSMTLICIMLLITIGTLSSGLGLADVMTKDLNEVTPFDLTMQYYSSEESDAAFEEILGEQGMKLSDYPLDYKTIPLYNTGLTYEPFFSDYQDIISNLYSYEDMKETLMPVIPLSAYNGALTMRGLDPVSLENGQYIISCDYDEVLKLFREFIKDGGSLEFDGRIYTPAGDGIIESSIVTSTMKTNTGLLVLPDSSLEGKGYPLHSTVYNINYLEGNEMEDPFIEKIDQVFTASSEGYDAGNYYMYVSRREAIDQGAGLKTILSYLAIYIGVVFLITCAAVLALQQLSESSDNAYRYSLLKKIGAENKMVNRALFSQIFIYFMMPLGLAIVHSVVGLKVANDIISTFGHLDILANLIFTAAILVLIYGGYFLATYFGSKSMIREKK